MMNSETFYQEKRRNPYMIVGFVVIGVVVGALAGRLIASTPETVPPTCQNIRLETSHLIGEQGLVFAYDENGIPCLQDLRTRAWVELPLGNPQSPTSTNPTPETPSVPQASSTQP